MKNIIFSFAFILSCVSLNAQDLRSYTVQQGESFEDVASKFQVDVSTLQNLNPHLLGKQEIENQLIVVPNKPGFRLNPKIKLKTYDVSPKETLYSIAKSYNLKVKDLRTYNPFLNDRELDYNDVLRIPTYELNDTDLDINQSVKNSEFNTLKHLVLPKETKYGISRKYGLSIDQLVELNPSISDKEIQPGQFLNIKRPTQQEKKPVPESQNYTFLKVGANLTLQSILKNYNVTQDALIKSNPSLKFEGLSEGLVLKIPLFEELKSSKHKKFNIKDELKYFQTKRIAVMLPLNLERTERDTIKFSSILKNSNLLRISLDMYEGIHMAIDSAATMGISVDLDVYDTKNNPSHVRKLLSDDFKNYQAVIGPLLDGNLKVAANYLSQDDVPVISPLVNPDFEYNNLFTTLPKEEELQELIITYIQQKRTDENLVILSDKKSKSIERKYRYTFRDIKTVEQEEPEYLQMSDVKPHLDSLSTNWVILESEDLGIAGSAVSFLKSLQANDWDIKLFTSKRSAFYDDEISNYYLSDLGFLFPSISKSQLSSKHHKNSNAYFKKYGYYPNRYVMRGYDVMLDILLRLSYAETLQQSTKIQGYTEYIENKFNYVNKEFSLGYQNDAIYLLEYQDNLKIEAIDLYELLKNLD